MVICYSAESASWDYRAYSPAAVAALEYICTQSPQSLSNQVRFRSWVERTETA